MLNLEVTKLFILDLEEDFDSLFDESALFDDFGDDDDEE